VLFNRLLRVRNEVTSGLTDPAQWLVDLFGGGVTTSSGEQITAVNSLEIATVYACVNIKSNAIAKLPMQVFKTTPTGRERDREHQAAKLLEVRPNPFTTPFTFKHTISVHQNLWGTAYVYMENDPRSGKVIALWLLPPDATQPYKDLETGLYTYITTLNNTTMRLQESEVIRLPYLSLDGVRGKSPIQVARETLGVMRASNKFIGGFYRNGTSTKGIIETPTALGAIAKDALRSEWQKANGGVDNAGGVAIVDGGMKYQSISMPLADAEFIATGKFNVAEIAKIFNVPLHKLAELDRATFSNIESQSMDFIQDSTEPSLILWEQEFSYKLFCTPRDAGRYVKFNRNSALRGDSASRALYYKEVTGLGAYSINEVRELEEMEDIGPEGDQHRVDLNHINVTLADEYQLAKAKNPGKTPTELQEVGLL